MLTALTALLLAAPAAQLKLATLDVNLVGFGTEARGFYTQHVGAQLNEAGADATTPQQIAAVLGMERQKQLLGCGEQSSDCLVELANALGVDGLVMIDIAKVGSVYQLSARVIDAARGQAVATFSKRVDREEDLLEAISEGTKSLVRDAATALNRSIRVQPRASPGIARSLSWIPALGAVGLGVTGVGLLVQSDTNHKALTSPEAPSLDLATARKLRDDGAVDQTLGVICVGVGSAALITAAAMLIFGGPHEPATQVSITPLPGGAAVMLGGMIP